MTPLKMRLSCQQLFWQGLSVTPCAGLFYIDLHAGSVETMRSNLELMAVSDTDAHLLLLGVAVLRSAVLIFHRLLCAKTPKRGGTTEDEDRSCENESAPMAQQPELEKESLLQVM